MMVMMNECYFSDFSILFPIGNHNIVCNRQPLKTCQAVEGALVDHLEVVVGSLQGEVKVKEVPLPQQQSSLTDDQSNF